jgi:predicted nuclease with TOPRIM domain
MAQVSYANVVTDVNSKNLIAMRAEMTKDREEYKAELDDVRKDVKTARDETAAVREENRLLREKLDELEDVREWAERLAHQVVSLGGTPVKMRERKSR